MTLLAPSLGEFPNFLKSIESKWRLKLMRRFERQRFVGSKSDLKSEGLPRYMLSMFPYPSGKLHLGHVRIYTSGDILTRYSRLLSQNERCSVNFSHVINPMGFDSFGLPAENAARERGLNPAVWTNTNIRTMKQQLDDLALQFDWREATSNPSFYKWTQDLFLRLMDAGLVYKSYSKVNWDPVDKTVLADEQVDEEGRSWRSGALVEQRNLRQWFVKVNAFTNDIYDAQDIDPDTWKDILTIQRNWIGKPCGWLFYVPLKTDQFNTFDTVPIFTKSPELFVDKEAKLIISDDHWLEKVHGISKQRHIINPFTGDRLPVELTNKIDDLPPNCLATLSRNHRELNGAITPSMDVDEEPIIRKQVLLQAKLNGLGGYFTSDKYRDWLVSRQRFWGTPIPTVHCPQCGHKGVPKDSLPVQLPSITSMNSDLDSNESDVLTTPIDRLAPPEWIQSKCPSCGNDAKREGETFDTLFDSSWYFLRYASSPMSDKPFNPELVQPVWCYIGGKEHASMHLFYARFITHFLHSQGALDFKEPFTKLLVQGVVKSRTYKFNGRYLTKEESDSIGDKSKLTIEYEKMSKSKGNGVDPQELLDEYGIDATRFCLMSYANPRSERLWRDSEEEFRDTMIFLRRVTLTVQEYHDAGEWLKNKSGKSDETGKGSKIKELTPGELNAKRKALTEARNRSAIDAMFNIQEACQFRQYIAALHVLIGQLRGNIDNSAIYTKEFADALATLIVMLNPITPHLSEELWSHFAQCAMNPLKFDESSSFKVSMQASDQPWPIADDDYPLTIKIRAVNGNSYIDKIPISKQQLREASKSDLSRLVESHFLSKGDKCEVVELNKFDDLMAFAVIKADPTSKRAKDKIKKKKNQGSSI